MPINNIEKGVFTNNLYMTRTSIERQYIGLQWAAWSFNTI